jgi:FlaA1/EpsC-like NDP-sugar epimerase
VIPSLENIDWHRFLRRQRLCRAYSETFPSLRRNSVLITGAGGSIGSALALRLALRGAKIILLESSEGSLYDLQSEFAGSGPGGDAVFYLGGAGDRELLNEIFTVHQPRTVFHAAAFKHVPLLEEQPLAAIQNNVFGTEALVEASTAHRARLILLSTDKAVAPASVMGATKRVAEQIVLASGGTVLRLGNVLASRGSVAEVFAGQIAAGEPLTVTHREARRYFLTLAEAVDLLISACDGSGPTLFVPRLGDAHSIAGLARFIGKTLAPDREFSVEFTGLRAGDKLAEELWSAEEIVREESDDLLRVESAMLSRSELQIPLDRLHGAVRKRDLINAISNLRTLVPDYTPSGTLLAATPVPHE